MRHLMFVLLLFVIAALPAGAQKKAFTIADLYRLRSVEDPQVSPDGKLIAFVVRESNL